MNPHGHPERGGTGYLPRERQQALNRYRYGVRGVGLGMSDRTLRRWSKRPVGNTLENGRNQKRGRQRGVSELEVGVAHVVKAAHPTASATEVAHVIGTVTGQAPPRPYAITRILRDYNPYLTLSLKKAESHATEGCPVMRAMWHVRPPPLGHYGTPTARLCDFDESCFYFDHANRVVAHARPGSTPVVDQSHDMGTKLTVVVGVDCIGSSWIRIRDENLNEEGWLDFLTRDVLPFCGPNRSFMYDNLRAHVTARATQLIIQSGHTPLARPVHSPWLAPIEFIFGLMEAHLRRISPLVTSANFRRCIMHAYLAATSPANCAAIFRHCGL